MKFRIGIGYDVHPLRKGGPLILGGVEVPSSSGLEGYSDADVLLHAIMDALLGAAALGDIGNHFRAGEPRYRGISSILLLREVAFLLAKSGYEINNIDSVIVAQYPRLSTYLPKMRRNIAGELNMEVGDVSVKATTTERLGFTGRKEGIAAYATALIFSSPAPIDRG